MRESFSPDRSAPPTPAALPTPATVGDMPILTDDPTRQPLSPTAAHQQQPEPAPCPGAQTFFGPAGPACPDSGFETTVPQDGGAMSPQIIDLAKQAQAPRNETANGLLPWFDDADRKSAAGTSPDA